MSPSQKFSTFGDPAVTPITPPAGYTLDPPQASSFGDPPDAPPAGYTLDPPQQSDHSGFFHSLYDATIGGAIGTLKTAIGTDQLDDIAAKVKAGDYKGAALALGQYATQGPAGRIGDQVAQGSIDAAKQAGQDVSAGNYGQAAIHGIQAVPVVGPLVSRPIDQAAQGDYSGALGTLSGDALMLGAGKLAEAGAGAVDSSAASAADALRRQSLRGGYTVNTPAADVTAAAQTMRDANIPMTAGGAQKISQALADLQQQKVGLARQATQAGGTIDPLAVDSRALDTARKWAVQVDPTADLRAISKTRQGFMDRQTQTIPAKPASTVLGPNGQPATAAIPAGSRVIQIPLDEAEALKEGTYSKVYDQSPGGLATAAAEKALARGLKEEIEAQVPEMGKLNASQAKLLNLQGILEQAVNKYSNNGGLAGSIAKNTFSLKGLNVGAATGLASHSPIYGASAAVLQSILADPMVQSRLAQAIDWGRRAAPQEYGPIGYGAALARVNSYQQSLGGKPGEQDPKGRRPQANWQGPGGPNGQ
jgi:hypothetical protein